MATAATVVLLPYITEDQRGYFLFLILAYSLESVPLLRHGRCCRDIDVYKRQAWFRIRDGTQVYVEGGSRITVELSEEPQLLVITSLLLSAGMALVLSLIHI